MRIISLHNFQCQIFSSFLFNIKPQSLVFSDLTYDCFKIPAGALHVVAYFFLIAKATVLFWGLLFHMIHAFLRAHTLCDRPVSLQSCWFLSFLTSHLLLPTPIPLSFRSSQAEDIKLNALKTRIFSKKTPLHSNMHVWCPYTAQRTGRRFGRTISMCKELERFHPHEQESHTNINISDAIKNLCYSLLSDQILWNHQCL